MRAPAPQHEAPAPQGQENDPRANRVASLFVHGLLGRGTSVPAVRIAPSGVTRAYGDARGLHLPAAYPMYGQREDRPLAYRARFAAAAHLAAHVAFGDGRLPRGSLRPIQIVLVSLFEDARVERLAARGLPGLGRLWSSLHTAAPTDLQTFPALCARLSRALLDRAYEDPHPVIVKARQLFFHPDHPLDSAEGLRRLGSLLGNDVGQMRLSFTPKTYVVEPPYRDNHRLLWEERPADAKASPIEEAEVEEQIAPRRDDDRALNAPPPDVRDREPSRPRHESTGRAREAAPIVAVADNSAPSRAARYPEWDYQLRTSRPGWCTVRDQPVAARPDYETYGDAGDGVLAAAEVERDVEHFVGNEALARVSRLARQLRVEALVKTRRERDGDVLDLDAAVAATVDRRAGAFADGRVYSRTARHRRNLAVLLLLNLSASTAEPVQTRPDGPAQASEPPRQRIIDSECRAAVLLGELLSRTGNLFAMHGFSSDGRHHVEYRRFKELDTPWELAARRALRDVSPRLSTRMGAALRHAGRCLANVRRDRRLILVLTDGEPSDVDAPDPRYLPEDARQAVAEQRRRGIHTFAVSLEARSDPVLHRIFGRGACCTIDRLTTLPDALPRIYASLVR